MWTYCLCTLIEAGWDDPKTLLLKNLVESDKDADTTAKFTRDTTGLFIYA